MQFASDNTGPVHPKVLESLSRANEGYAMGYGADPIMEDVTARIRDLFDAPEAAVHLVINGTTANSLILATMSNPWDTIFCADIAHIEEDEANAPEFFTGGAKLTLVPSDGGKIAPDDLQTKIEAQGNRGVHGPQRGPLSITQATETGSIYSLPEIKALTDTASNYGLATHLDGARFANAMVRLGCSAADMTTHAGIQTVSFGGTKNGLMGVEACVLLDPALSDEFQYRRKRAGHLLSKHRYLSWQMQSYLKDDLWIDMATLANTASDRLRHGMQRLNKVTVHGDPASNLFFASFPAADHQRLRAAGAVYYADEAGSDPAEQIKGRFVTNWSTTEAEVDRFLDLLAT